MAVAITAPTVTEASYGRSILQGMNMRLFGIGCGSGTDDYWDSGISGISSVAWKPTTSTDYCAPTVSGSRITFNLPSAAATTGILIIWSEG